MQRIALAHGRLDPPHPPLPLVVAHDRPLQGREFAELDILGLASVGLSTKVGRTIGFMGVGFKAVYKRFDRVEIRDSQRFSFAFERPQSRADKQSLRPEDSHSFAWVLLPRWCNAPKSSVPFDRGCLFLLERPKGGLQSVRRDLEMLPPSTIPLLGHTVSALRRASTPVAAPFPSSFFPPLLSSATSCSWPGVLCAHGSGLPQAALLTNVALVACPSLALSRPPANRG